MRRTAFGRYGDIVFASAAKQSSSEQSSSATLTEGAPPWVASLRSR
ncbi:hypothetical protein [Methylobacterium sp. A52T]